MYGVVLVVVVALVSLLVARIATIALTATGLARSAARFQARSALSGVGFTTTESEAVVEHPARRRIVMALMLVGNAGIVTAIAGVLGGVLSTTDVRDGLVRAGVLVGGLGVVYAASLSPRVDRALSRVIGRLLGRYTDLDVRDYAALLHVSGEYAVTELFADHGSWLTCGSLGDLRLRDEGILVLGVVHRDGSYLGAPRRDTVIEAGDTLILYGRAAAIAHLSGRAAGVSGERAHEEGVVEQQDVETQQESVG